MMLKPFAPHARRLYAGRIVALIASLILPLDEAAGATTFDDLSVYNHPGASCPHRRRR